MHHVGHLPSKVILEAEKTRENGKLWWRTKSDAPRDWVRDGWVSPAPTMLQSPVKWLKTGGGMSSLLRSSSSSSSSSSFGLSVITV